MGIQGVLHLKSCLLHTLPHPTPPHLVWLGALIPASSQQTHPSGLDPANWLSYPGPPPGLEPPFVRRCSALRRQRGAVKTEKRTALPAPSPGTGSLGWGSGDSPASQSGLEGEPGRVCTRSSGDPRLQGRGRYFGATAAVVPASPAKGSKFPGSELPPLPSCTPHPAPSP